MTTLPNSGDTLTVRVLHADGQCFRHWRTPVERITPDCLIMLSMPGQQVLDSVKGIWISSSYIRAYYWFERPYNLLEIYDADGTLNELYINVASFPTLSSDTLTWTDHELDVSKLPGQPARIIDQDEFADAARRYGYSPEFQAHCHAVSEDVRQLAEVWIPAGL